MIFIIIVGVLLIIIGIAGIILAKYLAARKNQDKLFETHTLETSSTTDIPNKYIKYGFIESDIILNESFLLDSTLTYNSEDKILYYGYVTTITLSLYQRFNQFSSINERIHFFVILNNIIISSCNVAPHYDLLHTYEIPEWTLIVKPGSFLCVSIDTGDTSSADSFYQYGNKIHATQFGKAYSLSNYFSPYNNHIQSKWNEQDFGIALSFTIVHNPKWNGTIPLHIITTTTNTLFFDTNKTYGSINEDIFNESISLNSFLFYNWGDACNRPGYIININIKFCKPFQSSNTVDGRLWFFIMNGEIQIIGKYSVIPSNTLLIQSFSIPQGEFIIGKENFLSVGTLSNNSYENNTICLRKTGYAFQAKIENNIIDNYINPKWRGSEIGIALSYIVFSNAETEKTNPPLPEFG